MALFTYVFFQNEKCHLLIEHETQKLKELDEEHSQEIKEWREKLRPRKKVFFFSVHFLFDLKKSFFFTNGFQHNLNFVVNLKRVAQLFVSSAPCRR